MDTPLIVRPNDSILNVISFDEFISRLRSASHHSMVYVDLRELKFIDLFAAIGVIFYCHEVLETRSCKVHLELSENGACNFLPRMGFFKALPDGISTSETFSTARLAWEEALRGSNPKFLELTVIKSNDVIDEILDKLIRILRYNLKYRKSDALDMAQAFSEVSHNIIDHNPLGTIGYAAMQVFKGKKGRFLQMVIADRGLGIRTTLNQNPIYAQIQSDKDAILTSTGLGVSGRTDNVFETRGNGLFELLAIMKKHGGAVHIRSGSGRVYWDDKWNKTFPRDVPPMDGVQVLLNFPSRRK